MEETETLSDTGIGSAGRNFKLLDKSNKRLVKKAIRGNPEAISRVIALYYKDILYFAAKKVGLQEAEDVAQEAISKIVDRIKTLQDPNKVKSWMMKIVRDSCVDYTRRDILKNKLFSSINAAETSGFEAEESTSDLLPEAALDRIEMREQVLKSIDTLPENYADALRLYYLDEFGITNFVQSMAIKELPRMAKVALMFT